MKRKKIKKLYKRERYSNKEKWLDNRGFGGSSASAILDVNPWMSKLELYKSFVLKNKKPINEENESMQYGTRCEGLMRELYALDFEHEYRVHKPKQYEMYRRLDKPYLTATVDGILKSKLTGKKGIWECKTHDIRNYEDEVSWRDGIPQNYYIQCLHYLLVLNDCEFVILNAKLRYFDYHQETGKKLLKQEIIYHTIYRDEVLDQLEYLERKETEFYEDNILKRKMPIVMIKF